uniref:Uncharacterized protein n=1 Tax=Arundo donax TaxID=35708 RepID=A0A0A8YDM6_ARUDO
MVVNRPSLSLNTSSICIVDQSTKGAGAGGTTATSICSAATNGTTTRSLASSSTNTSEEPSNISNASFSIGPNPPPSDKSSTLHAHSISGLVENWEENK